MFRCFRFSMTKLFIFSIRSSFKNIFRNTRPVFVRAFLLARRSKAPEICIEHLLAALDEGMPLAVESSIRPEPPFLPGPHQDLPLSPGAAAALEPLGDIFHVSLKALRNVLLDAQRRGAT